MSQESLEFVCPSCGKSCWIAPQAIGHHMRCPHCNEVVDLQPPAPPEPMDIQQTVEMTPAEARRAVNTEILQSAGPEIAEPPVAVMEPEAPPVMRAPLARPAGGDPPPSNGEPLLDQEDKPPDARVPKRKLVPQESEMDMTPMVDCVFQLLIFFMLTASFSVQKSLLVPKPTIDGVSSSTTEPKEESLEEVTVRIDAQGHYFVSGGGLTDELEASARVELIMRLKAARNVAGSIPNKLMVLAHGDCMHERVVEAIDAGNDVGMEEVALKTIEDDDQ